MNPYHFFCIVDRRAPKARARLEAYQKEMARLYPVKFTIEEFDGADIEWVERNRKFYASDEFVLRHTARIYEQHRESVDSVQFFVDDRNWQQGKVALRGFKLGRIFNGYFVTFTRFRNGYEETGEHETLHLTDDYVEVNTGVKLEQVLGVDDFDDDVVHSPYYWKQLNYKYDEVWAKISGHVSNAVFQRRQQTFTWQLQMLQQAMKALMQQMGLIKYNSNSIPEIEIKKEHTSKCYELYGANAIIGHIDLGTEEGTKNEILNGTRSVSYHWYIPRHAKYVIEYVPEDKGAWHAGVLHEPQPELAKLLGGANGILESGEPNRYAYGICYEGRTTSTAPTQAQLELAKQLLMVKKIDHLPIIAHWQVTSYKPRIVSQFVDGLRALLTKK